MTSNWLVRTARNLARLRWMAVLLLVLVAASRGPVEGSSQELQPHPATQLYFPFVAFNQPRTFYVSKRGSNGDGQSWSTAWNELNQINWQIVRPGDTILLDGGTEEMVYSTSLVVRRSGNSYQPIRIALAQETGRDGRAVLFGGRATPLPYCGQRGYVYVTAGVRRIGIDIGERSWITIDGRKWGGIAIYGHSECGIQLKAGSHHITIRNAEVWDNGWAYQEGNAWYPDGPGIDPEGSNITFERLIVHDNGQDAFQSGGPVADIILRQCWLYNTRRHPNRNEPFNYCQHPDGVQIYNGGRQSGLLIEECVIGPGFMQGLILGQTPVPSDNEATIDNVTLRHSLFTKAGSTNIMGYPSTKPQGWVIDHVTAHIAAPSTSNLFLEGSNHTVRDSIFMGGALYLPDGLSSYSGNCQWLTRDFRLGQVVNPLFTSVSSDWLSLDDYRLAPGSPCAGRGSRITSAAQLLAEPDTPHS